MKDMHFSFHFICLYRPGTLEMILDKSKTHGKILLLDGVFLVFSYR